MKRKSTPASQHPLDLPITIAPLPSLGFLHDVDGAPLNPFLQRLETMVLAWLHQEWEAKEQIKQLAATNGWSARLETMLEEASLTPVNLAQRLDNISEATLRRELHKLDAPKPGDIIRAARIEYAKHLLTHTRLPIHKVAVRAGYSSEKHFAKIFSESTGGSPTEYRRSGIRR